MSLAEHEWTNVRRSTVDIRPPRVKPEREDWRDLSIEDQHQVALVLQDLAHPEICSLKAQAYIRRHGKHE